MNLIMNLHIQVQSQTYTGSSIEHGMYLLLYILMIFEKKDFEYLNI